MTSIILHGGTFLADIPRASHGGPLARVRSHGWRWSSKFSSSSAESTITEQPSYEVGGEGQRPLLGLSRPAGHFLGIDRYQPRRFVTARVKNVLYTRHAKAIGAAGNGFIEEFNISGSEGLPRSLLRSDLEPLTSGGYIADPSEVEKVEGLSIPIGHYGMATFGHFVLDSLLQVYLFETHLIGGHARLAHWPLAHGWMEELLDRCGATPPRRRLLRRPVALLQEAGLSSALAAHGVYFPGAYSPDFFRWLRTKLVKRRGAARRLYLRRPETFARKIINQSDLEAALTARGFAVLDPLNTSVAEQAEAIAGAELAIGGWGSGLTLTPLMSGARQVIELLPKTVTDPWFLRQAVVHDLNYHPIFLESTDADNTIVNIKQVVNQLTY